MHICLVMTITAHHTIAQTSCTKLDVHQDPLTNKKAHLSI